MQWLAKRLIQKGGLRGKNKELQFKIDDSVMDISELAQRSMCKVSKSILKLILPNIDKESRIRKENQKQWLQFLSEANIDKTTFSLLNGSYTPYLAAFSCENSDVAERIFTTLQNKRLPVSTWPDLPKEVLLDEKMHKVAIKLRKTRFFLPVHSSLKFQ